MHRTADNRVIANILIAGVPAPTLCELANVLRQRGHNVCTLSDAPQLQTALHRALPDLLLLDVRLPPEGGLAACTRLVDDPETHHLPIVLTGVTADPAARARAFAAGAADLLVRPFSPPEALARIETQLRLHTLQRRVVRQETRVERMRAEWRRAHAEQQRLIANLEAYAHTVAHDLKGPLSQLAGFADILPEAAAGRNGGDAQPYLDAIRRTAYKSINIVDELLLLATVRKLEEIDLTVVDMGTVVDEACDRLVWLIWETDAEVRRPNLWPTARGYAPWVEQVWVNYISNAIRYGGDPPRLQLGSSARPDGMVRFWLHDNGPGLDSAEQEGLFQTVSPSEPVRTKGHGLGLSIVRRIVHMLGGRVGVESASGQGSTFWFTLPAA